MKAAVAEGCAAVRRRAPRPSDALAVTIFLGFGLGVVLPKYIIGSAMPGDLGDARFNLAVLEFFYRTLLAFLHGRPASFVNAPFFYPWPKVANFSDTFWGDGEVYALARGLGCSELAAFRIWVVLGFALTYAAAFLSFRKLGLRSWGAATGAFLFAFALPMTAQIGHAQLLYRLWVPPAVVALDRLLTRGSWQGGAASVLFLGLQFAASVYIGLFLCLLLASWLAAMLLVGRERLALPLLATLRSGGRAGLGATAFLLAAGIGVLAAVAIPYHQVQVLYGFGRSWPEVASLLPRPGSYLLAGWSLIYPNLSPWLHYPFPWEQQLFPGLAAIIALAWFLGSRSARRRNKLAAVLLAATGILFLATIDVGGWTFYRLIFPLPGFSAMRAVSRVVLVMLLPPAVLLGILIDELAAPGAQRTVRCSLAVALSALLLAECSLVRQDVSTPADWRGRAEALLAKLPKDLPPDAVLAVRTRTMRANVMAWIFEQIDAEVVATELGIRTINGYSGNSPPGWRTLATCHDVGHDLRAGRHFLAEHGLPTPRLRSGQLVLVGFAACNRADLGADPLLELGRRYRFAAGGPGNAFVGDGFSHEESWGRWTDSRTAFLFFRLRILPPGPTSIAVDARSFSSRPDRRQAITVSANHRACGRFVLTGRDAKGQVVCPAGVLGPGDNVVRFRIARPARPIDIGMNSDTRQLGLGLVTLTIAAKE